MCNKKVLLCEHKRHTARCVTSTRYAVLVGGTPTWEGGTPLPGKVVPPQKVVPPLEVVPPGKVVSPWLEVVPLYPAWK